MNFKRIYFEQYCLILFTTSTNWNWAQCFNFQFFKVWYDGSITILCCKKIEFVFVAHFTRLLSNQNFLPSSYQVRSCHVFTISLISRSISINLSTTCPSASITKISWYSRPVIFYIIWWLAWVFLRYDN